MSERIEFVAALAGTNSAAKWLTVANEGDGKIVFEFPTSELQAVLRLAPFGQSLLRISVEVDEGAK